MLTLCLYACTAERAVGGSSRKETNTGGRRTETAIGRRVIYLQFFTGTLRNEGGRTAAVTVSSPNAACGNHNLCTLVHIHTGGEGRLTTVVFHHNNLTVCSDTYNGARCGIAFMRSLVLIYSIFYNISAGNRNYCIFPTVKVCGSANLRHFKLGNVSRSRITVFIKILVDNHTSGESDVAVVISAVAGIEHDLAIHHHETERFAYTICRIAGVPGQATIHYTNYFAVHIPVDPVSLVEHRTRLILRRVHLGIRRNYAYV